MIDTISLSAIIIIIFGGIIAACIMTYYTKNVLGGLVKRLCEKNACDKDTAKELSELGYSDFSAKIIALSLGKNASLRKYVMAYYTDEEMSAVREVREERKIRQRYYIPENAKETALSRYNGDGMSFGKLILCIVLCVIAAVVCSYAFPYVVGMFKK